MGHPVLGVHQQWITQPAEHPLHGFDQLDAEDRRRRHDDRRRVIEQFLLQFAEGFPVQQARRLLEVHLAAPAPRAGIEHHHGRRGGQHVVPVLEAQQLIDQRVLDIAVQVMVIAGGAE
ncbi:hypothetical protein D3C73_1326300 [compost metagenome]